MATHNLIRHELQKPTKRCILPSTVESNRAEVRGVVPEEDLCRAKNEQVSIHRGQNLLDTLESIIVIFCDSSDLLNDVAFS